MSSLYYTIPEPNEMVVCPYDAVHVVAYKRLPYHLMKCRKNHPTRKMGICHFNARHTFPEAEMRFHLMDCPDRTQVERYTTEDVKNRGYNEVPTYFPEVQVHSSEDWEAESLATPRIGVPASEMAGIGYIKNLQGMKPAQKRQFYQNLRNNRPEDNIRLIASLNNEGETEDQENSQTFEMSGLAQAMPATTSIGRGRGRGAARRDDASTKPATSSASDQSAPSTAKEIRSLRKKLAQIDKLCIMAQEGKPLQEEERVKIALKATFEAKLAALTESA